MSSTQRVREHRKKQNIKHFINDYIEGRTVDCDCLTFISAKELEFCVKSDVAEVTFHSEFIDRYVIHVAENNDRIEDSRYPVTAHIEAWDIASEAKI